MSPITKDKAPTVPKAPKKVKGQHSNDGVVPELPRTSFNFIAASWGAKRKKRYTNAAASFVVGVVMITLVLAGVWASAGNGALQTRLTTAQNARDLVETETRSITGGVVNIDGHETVRREEISDIYGKDVDTSYVLEQLLLLTPTSIRITSLTITGPVTAAPVERPPVDLDAAAEEEETEVTVVEEVVPAGPAYSILVTAVTDDLKAAEAWKTQLASADSPFVAANPVISGSSEALLLSLSASLIDTDVLTELNRINSAIGWVDTQTDTQTEAPPTTEGEG